MAETVQEINIVSQLDEYNRFAAIFHDGLEAEFLNFVQSRGQRHVQWLQSKEDLKTLKEEYEMTVMELGHWRTNFADMRSRLQIEQSRRIELEHQLTELVTLLQDIKEVVDRDTSLPDQTKERFAVWKNFELTDFRIKDEIPDHFMDFDKSGEVLDFDQLHGKALSPGEKRTNNNTLAVGLFPSKRQRLSPEVKEQDNSLDTVATEFPIPLSKQAICKQESVPISSPLINLVHAATHKRRSNSEPEAITFSETGSSNEFRPVLCSVNSIDKSCMRTIVSSFVQYDVSNSSKKSITPRLQNTTNMQVRHNSGSKLNSRAHDFASKTVIRPETCVPCGRRIKFSKQALKCHSCRVTCHPECKLSVPLPCIPMERTPKRTGKTVADFAPQDPPRVPSLIILCVNEVESRGMKEVGLYRLSAPEREITAVKEKFTKGKGLPNLLNVDVHVLCATVKHFLRNLEPLIPRLTWKEFASAAAIKDNQESQAALYQYIGQLPQPNRDTLAFLILHWQRVAESQNTKMTIKNLAMVLGPTVVGNSTPSADPGIMLEEQTSQVQIMEKLLMIPTEFWKHEQDNSSFLVEPGSVTPTRTLRLGTSLALTSPRGRVIHPPVTRKERFFTSPKV